MLWGRIVVRVQTIAHFTIQNGGAARVADTDRCSVHANPTAAVPSVARPARPAGSRGEHLDRGLSQPDPAALQRSNNEVCRTLRKLQYLALVQAGTVIIQRYLGFAKYKMIQF